MKFTKIKTKRNIKKTKMKISKQLHKGLGKTRKFFNVKKTIFLGKKEIWKTIQTQANK